MTAGMMQISSCEYVNACFHTAVHWKPEHRWCRQKRKYLKITALGFFFFYLWKGRTKANRCFYAAAFNVVYCAAKNEVSDCDWPVFMCSCLFLSTQLDAWWSMVVKMVRMQLMGPLSWGRVKWPGIMGTGVLYLLLLSTCFGQDTEGKRSLYLSLFFTLSICSAGI